MSHFVLKVWVKITIAAFCLTMSLLLVTIYLLYMVQSIQIEQNTILGQIDERMADLNEYLDDSEIEICEF